MPRTQRPSRQMLATLKRQIFKALSDRGLTQAELALRLGAKPSTVSHLVSRIERGEANITLGTLEALARALEVPVAQLLTVPQAATMPASLTSRRRPRAGTRAPVAGSDGS